MAGAVSGLAEKLQNGEFVVTAELLPPVGTDPTLLRERARSVKGLVAAVNITDGAGAKSHMSSLVAAHFMMQEGVEPILQFTCRDRNRLGLQNDLIGAMALGMRNFLFLKGDDPKVGDQPDTKPVFDLDSQGLLTMAHHMRSEKKLPSGVEIKGEVGMFLGAADAPIDPPADWTPASLKKKIDAGADFIQTQFCMDVGVVTRYARRLIEHGIVQKAGLIIGIAPIPSAKSARWMKEKLFGTIIPDEIVARLEAAAEPKEEGKKICAELIQQLSEIPGVAGAHVMAPANPSMIAEVVTMANVAGKKRAKI